MKRILSATAGVFDVTERSQNPYQAPAHGGSPGANPRVHVFGGLLAGAIGAVVGFAIPPLAASAIDLLRGKAIGLLRMESLAGLMSYLDMMIEPCAACAAVFAFAAVLNYVPARRLGLVRALMCTGCLALLGGLLMAVATLAFGIAGPTLEDQLRSQGTVPDSFRPLRIAILLSVPTIGGVLLTLRRIGADRCETTAGKP